MYHLMKKTLTVIIFLISFMSLSYAQISIQNPTSFPITASALVDTIKGTGVQITNVSFVGDSSALGYFYTGNNTVGISSGLVISTGKVLDITLPVNVSSATSTNLGTNGDADLTAIANAQTYDANILEMDFVSTGDSVELQMVFASEEYPEYVCAFNDVFAFLVSGDGFNGSYSNGAENVAVIPGTNAPISINTVNGGTALGTATPCITTNTAYYIDNPYVSIGTSLYPIYFDGMTTVIKVKFAVTPDSTYHFKIAIADALDQVFDSAIFLKAKSFSSNGNPFPNPQLAINTSLGSGWVNEICGSIELGIDLEAALISTDTFEILTGGTATNGVDYVNMPTQFIGNIGDTTINSVIVDVVSDNIIESVENIYIYLKHKGIIIDSALISISDSSMFSTNLQNTSICSGDTIILDASIIDITGNSTSTFSNNMLLPIFDNSPSVPTISTINVSGVPTGASVESVCLNISHLFSADMDIYLVSPTLQIVELSTDNGGGSFNYYTNTCFSQSATTSIVNAPVSATGIYLPEQSLNTFTGLSMNGNWSLIVIDDAIGFVGTLNSWSISFSNSANLNYSWLPSNLVDCDTCNTVNVSPATTTNYQVAITDFLGCTINDSATVGVLQRTQFNLLPCNVTDSTITFNWQTDGTETESQISFNNGLTWTTLSSGIYSYTRTNLQPGSDYSIMLRCNNQNCDGIPLFDTCTTSGCLPVNYVVTAIDETATGFGSIHIGIMNSVGNVHYQWSTGDTTSSLFNLPAGIYSITITDDNNCPISEDITICGFITPTITTVPDTNFTNLGAINVSIQGGFPPFVYQWNNGSTGNTLSGLLTGTYNAIVIDALGCSHTISVTVSDVVSDYNISVLEKLTISPNPTADLLNIQMTLSEYLPVNIALRDMTGKLLMNKSLKSHIEHQTSFDLSDFPNGTYILQFQLEDKIFSKQVILQR